MQRDLRDLCETSAFSALKRSDRSRNRWAAPEFSRRASAEERCMTDARRL
jgi:hypothetical protein